MEIEDITDKIVSFGTILFLGASVLFLPLLTLSLYIEAPVIIYKILISCVLMGVFIAIVGFLLTPILQSINKAIKEQKSHLEQIFNKNSPNN